MRSERSTSAGTARRPTSANHGVVKTFFGWWAAKEQGFATAGRREVARRPSPQYPLASGDGAA